MTNQIAWEEWSEWYYTHTQDIIPTGANTSLGFGLVAKSKGKVIWQQQQYTEKRIEWMSFSTFKYFNTFGYSQTLYVSQQIRTVGPVSVK